MCWCIEQRAFPGVRQAGGESDLQCRALRLLVGQHGDSPAGQEPEQAALRSRVFNLRIVVILQLTPFAGRISRVCWRASTGQSLGTRSDSTIRPGEEASWRCLTGLQLTHSMHYFCDGWRLQN